MSIIRFGYWGVRGKGQVPRLLLAYTSTHHQQTTYNNATDWFQRDKFNLGLPFPNLPYLIDGNIKITETQAISRYIIQKSGKIELLGRDLHERTLVNNIVGVIEDCFNMMAAIIYQKNGLTLKENNWKKMNLKIDYLVAFKGSRKWLLPELSWGDFLFSEFSNYVENVYPQKYHNFPFLHQSRMQFQSLPKIMDYYNSSTCFKGPFTSPQSANILF